MAIETWRRSVELAAEFAQLLPNFGGSKELSDWAQQYAVSHAGRCQWDARFLVARHPKGRFLNVGGSPFLFEFALRRESPTANITTVDLDPTRFPGVAEALGIKIIAADIERGDWQLPGEFDGVVFAEIFEHLRIDLLGTLARVHDALAPAGMLYLTTPNGLGLAALRRHYLRGRTGPSVVAEWAKLSRLGHMGHVREYSAREVNEVLQHCGFEVEKYLFREEISDKWPMRDIILRLRPSLANEMVIICRRRI